jgi:leader peptidase (prepilin peptidase)/N-methyltransferase
MEAPPKIPADAASPEIGQAAELAEALEASEIAGAVETTDAAEATATTEVTQATEAAEAPDPLWQPIAARWRAPIAVVTVALLVGIVVRLGVHWSTLPVLAFASTAAALAVVDFAILLLPNDLTFPTALAVAVALVAQAVAEKNTHKLLTELEGSLAVAGFYLLLFALSRGGLGLGDVKVGAVAGALLAARDWQHILNGTFVSYVITVAVAIVLLIRKRKKFPYGPGLLAGTIAVLLMS